MHCEFKVLGYSKNGKIFKCLSCEDKFALMFNNITQVLQLSDFYKLRDVIIKLDYEYYFKRYPNEKKMHINTENKNLYFSFDLDEINELKTLMSDAYLKITVYENAKKNLN